MWILSQEGLFALNVRAQRGEGLLAGIRRQRAGRQIWNSYRHQSKAGPFSPSPKFWLSSLLSGSSPGFRFYLLSLPLDNCFTLFLGPNFISGVVPQQNFRKFRKQFLEFKLLYTHPRKEIASQPKRSEDIFPVNHPHCCLKAYSNPLSVSILSMESNLVSHRGRILHLSSGLVSFVCCTLEVRSGKPFQFPPAGISSVSTQSTASCLQGCLPFIFSPLHLQLSFQWVLGRQMNVLL